MEFTQHGLLSSLNLVLSVTFKSLSLCKQGKIGSRKRTCVGVPVYSSWVTGFRVQLTVRVSGVLLGIVVSTWTYRAGRSLLSKR